MEIDTVTRDRILIAKIIIFDSYNNGALTMRDLTEQEEYRVVIFMDGKLIDFQTGDELMHINKDEYGIVYPEIYANTMYIDELYNHPNLSDKEYEYAQELYAYYKFKEKLINEGKLRLFRQTRLY